MKKSVTISIFLGVFVAASILCSFTTAENVLSEEIIRLHIRAAGNEKEQQELKLAVRDRILKDTGHLFSGVCDTKEAEKIVKENINLIADVAEDEVRKNGYNLPVRVFYGKSDFPTLDYGEICIPVGRYKSLIVEIGEGTGQNWWCVMFPPLCFVRESCKEVPPESKTILSQNLGTETYAMISGGKPEIKFKIYELWKNMTKK